LSSELASDQLLKPLDSGPIREYRSALLRQFTELFDGFVITVMPS
jgi:hypothetical protein